MNKFATFALAAALSFAGSAAAQSSADTGASVQSLSAQATQSPIISFNTTLYENAGSDNAFHFSIGAKETTTIKVDFGFGPVEVLVEPAEFDSSASAITGTTVAGSVGSAGTVKIYGDASLIDYLDLEGVYITDLDISALANLEILYLNHNELKALDLTGHHMLQALYLSDNPFNASPLKLDPVMPDLTILEISNIGAIDQSINISNYPALASLDAYSTHDLRTVDPTGCPELLRLSLDCTSVKSLDVTQNPNLLILNISQTGITSIDLSNNPNLIEFYCTNNGAWLEEYKLESLDLSQLPNLQRLMCQGNDFTSLDVSHNTKLTSLYCNYNYLPTIDISNNPYIVSLNISNNVMDFTTMPLPREQFSEYYYYQRPMPLGQRSFPVNAEVDMSARVLRPGSETWFALFARQYDADGVPVDVELPSDYYSYADGKVTLLKSSSDSLYMAFANSEFPEYDLHTTMFMVKEASEYGKDNPAVKLRTRPTQRQIALSVGLLGATPEAPKTFSVDFGDGNPVAFTTTSQGVTDAPNASGAVKGSGSITVYVPEGDDMSALAIDGVALVSINVDGAPMLTDLKLTNCSLSGIALPWNRMLVNLDLSYNNLSSLDLTEGDGRNTKNFLHSLDVSHNKLTEVIPGFYQIAYADLSHNCFATIDLSKASNIKTLDLSNNQLVEIDIKDLETIETLNLSDNNLSSLLIPDYINFEDLDVSLNRFPLPELPLNAAPNYCYAPQKPWLLPAEAPVANLAMQIIAGEDAMPTTFAWFKADGTPVTGDGIVESSPGLFQLKDTSLGSIYCVFTNPAYPDLTGDNAYRTTEITVAPMPTHVACDFRTLADGYGDLVIRATAEASAIYIDWQGNGAIEQYLTGLNRSIYTIRTYAGADVKIYTYSPETRLDVFSLAAGPLEHFDGTGLGNSLIHLTVNGSHLTQDNITMPLAPELRELVLANSDITDLEIAKPYDKLILFNVCGCQLTTLDASPWPQLQGFYASQNHLSAATFDNPALWDLSLNDNALESIDVSKLPALEQLHLFTNRLHSLDVSMLANLKSIDISDNYFTFATLPEWPPSIIKCVYANQHPIDVQASDGVVDLSGNGATTFSWFTSVPTYDGDTGELSGDQLIEGTDYTIEDGVTTFLKDFNDVMCVMQNPYFPNLLLYTNFLNVTTSILDIEQDAVPSAIYDLMGRPVTNPSPGIYIQNNRKILIR